ncbi:MAG: hypothetical protein ABL925_02165 [Methylococcales bacterium]
MKKRFGIPLLFLGIPVLLCATLIFFGVSDTPDLPVGWTLTREDISRAKKILHEGSKTRPDEIGTIELTESDLNLAGNYLLNRYSKSAVHIEIKNNKVRFTVTMTLPKNQLGDYLNISFRLGNENNNDLPGITKFKVGKLLLPAKLAAFVIDNVVRHTSLNEYFILATRPIKAVKIGDKSLTITYHSSLESLIQAKNFLTHKNENPAQSIYQQKLIDIVNQHDPAWRLSLADLLKPLFALAYQRSTDATAIDENRSVIITVNDYVNQVETGKFIALPKSTNKQYPAFIYKRIDLAQHFIGSAAIVVSANGQVAKVIGEEKELSDAQIGSGFSFIDLAADRAGTRFGELATASPEKARKVQKIMAHINDYKEFMPDVLDLPEHMNENEFKQRFQAINSPAYQEVSKIIDSRIAALPIYKK